MQQASAGPRSSYRKVKMLPWCQDEKDEVLHNDFVKLLASMDSKTRRSASKHAVAAAEVLLKARKTDPDAQVQSRYRRGGDRMVAWHKQ